VAKTSAQMITDARQTNHRVNSSSALCETLQRMAQLLTSVHCSMTVQAENVTCVATRVAIYGYWSCGARQYND
jgi:hypothetical protein